MLDVYPFLRPLLFQLDPEKAHGLAIAALKRGLGPKLKIRAKLKANTRIKDEGDPVLNMKVCGLEFENPVGSAPGLDKQCEVMSEVLAFGFGFIEVGGVVPQPQTGNPKPRLFRIPQVRGIINRFNFNSDGMDVCARRIAAWRDRGADKRPGVLGVNIAKNKDTTDVTADYIAGLKTFASLADYITINVSCPNTANLRDLEGHGQLKALLGEVMAVRATLPIKPLLFVKIAPDQTDQQREDIAAAVLESGVDGMIVGNTTVTRPGPVPPHIAKEAGGFSGPAMMAPTTQLLSNMYKLTQGKIPLIGNCGIFSGADAYAKIRAGASLVQLYTALVYEGPAVVPRILRDLAALLHRDGFNSVAEAVGADHR